MALTVTSNTTSVLTMNSTADGGGTWSALGSAGAPSLDTDIYVEGTGAINAKLSAARGGFQVTTSTSYDLDDAGTPAGMVAFWASTQSNLTDTSNTGGITLRIGSSSTNYREWQVSTLSGVNGTIAYPGGFQRFVVDVSTTPNTVTATPPTMSAINYWGIQFDVSSTVKGNIKNIWVDAIHILTAADIVAGTAACTVSGTVATTGQLFNEITDNTNNTSQAFTKRVGGVIALNQPIQIGTTSGTNTFTSQNETCVWQAQKVGSGFFFLRFVGGSGTDTFTFGSVTGSGTTAVGTGGSTILSASPRWLFRAAETDIDTLQLYGSTFKGLTNFELGNTTSALGTTGSTYHAVSNVISDLSGQLTLNIGANTTNENANQVVGAGDADGSISLIGSTTRDVSDWQVIDGAGFENTGTAGTRTVTNHTFLNTSGNKPYISVQDSASAIWNMNDANDGSAGRPSITDQTELAFAGNSNGRVDENYTVTWSVQTPSGTALQNARAKILETSPSVALANESSTDSGGAASSTYLRARYVPNGASSLTTTTHTPSAFKVYKYGYLPYVASATINQPVTNTVALLDDTFQSETTASTARTFGDTTHTVSIENQTNPASIIKYTSGSGTLSVGNTVTGGTSSATGVVVEIIEGDSTAGTVMLDTRSSGNYTAGGESLSNGAGWTATMTASTETRYQWLVDADSLNMQELYDYFNAKADESPLDTATPTFFDTVIQWGRAEHGLPIQGSGTKFKTVRNVSLTDGWAVYNTDLGTVAFYTADNGSTFTPAATVTLTITVVDTSNTPIQNAQVAMYQTSDNTELINKLTNASGVASASFTYTSDVDVYLRIRKSTTASTRYFPVETTGTIESTGFSVTVTLRQDTISSA